MFIVKLICLLYTAAFVELVYVVYQCAVRGWAFGVFISVGLILATIGVFAKFLSEREG